MYNWYIINHGQQKGPYLWSEHQVVELVKSGRLGLSVMLWREGMSYWMSAGDVAKSIEKEYKVSKDLGVAYDEQALKLFGLESSAQKDARTNSIKHGATIEYDNNIEIKKASKKDRDIEGIPYYIVTIVNLASLLHVVCGAIVWWKIEGGIPLFAYIFLFMASMASLKSRFWGFHYLVTLLASVVIGYQNGSWWIAVLALIAYLIKVIGTSIVIGRLNNN